MENQEKTTLDRVLKEQHFKNAEEAIKGGEKTGSLKNPELVKELIEEYKGKTVQAPIEVIITSAIFLDAKELIGTIEALKYTVRMKIVEELKAKADKGESTAEAAMLALMIAMSNKMGKKDSQSKLHPRVTYEIADAHMLTDKPDIIFITKINPDKQM